MILQAIAPLFILGLCSAAEWDYSKYANDWPGDFPTCNGTSQSPINIDHETLVSADYSNFSFSVGYKVVQKGILENNGHTLQFAVDESYAASISGGPLTERYILNQFHLHWGSQSGQGSEHTVDGESFDAELHLVHYKSTYDNISAAVEDGQPDSLSVVGIFMREATTWDQWKGAKDSDSVNHLRNAALELSRNWKGPAAPSAEMEVVMDQFLSGITDLSGIYHYEGSLTTPGCNEIVQWIVMDTPLYIRSNGLISALKKNLDNNGDALQDNYRPPQAINDRTVYHFSRDDAAGLAAGSQDPCAPCGGGFYVNATHAYPDGGTKIAGADGYTGLPVAGVQATAIKTPEECQAKCAETANCGMFGHGANLAPPVTPGPGGFFACQLWEEDAWAVPEADWKEKTPNADTHTYTIGAPSGCRCPDFMIA